MMSTTNNKIPKMKNNSKYATWNCAGGMRNKKEHIEQYLLDYDLDVLFINESEIKSETNMDILKIKNYRLDLPFEPKPDHRCRVCAYVKSARDISQVFDDKVVEQDMIILKNKEEIIVGLYRQFKVIEGSRERQDSIFLNNLTRLATKHKNLIICGDFNFDYNKIHDQTYRNYKLASKIDLWSIEQSMTQIVKENTRSRTIIKNNKETIQESLLDQVYTNNSCRIVNLEVIPGAESDHDMVKIETISKSQDSMGWKNEKEKFKIRNWLKYDINRVNEELKNANWEEFYSLVCVEEINSCLEDIVMRIVEKNIPYNIINIRKDQIKNIELEKMKKRRRDKYREMKKSKTITKQEEYKRINREIKDKIRKLKLTRLKKELEKDRSTRPFWKFVKRETGNTREGIPEMLSLGTERSKDEKRKAEMFASYFKDSVDRKEEQTEIDYDQEEKVDQHKPMKDFRYGRLNITTERITEILRESKKSLASGWDEIPVTFYINHIEILAPKITALFNYISLTETFPTSWKVAKIIPTHKRGDNSKVENYRPISNICSLAKVFEKLILQSLQAEQEMSSHNLFGDNQHGFVKGRSTITAALTLQEKIAFYIDERRKKVAVTAVDMSAAFDLLDKRLLRKRMTQQGYPHQTINLIYEWLSDRLAYVQLNLSCSNVFSIRKGCIQGSVLGPTLFSILMSPLEKVHTEIVSYADDNYIIHIADNHEELKQKITSDNENVMKWLSKNGMIVNESKTMVTIFGKKNSQKELVTVNNTEITTQSQMNILGITFDQQLNWSNHIQKTVNKLKGVNQCIKHLKKYFRGEDLLTLVKTKILALLYYGSEVWFGPHTKKNLVKKVEKVCKQNLRVAISKDFQNIRSQDLYQITGILSPDNKMKLVHLQMLVKIWNKEDPRCIFEHMKDNRIYYNRRRNILFFSNDYRLKFGMNCFANRLKDILNNLEFNPVNMNKNQVKKNFIRQYGL